MTVEKTPPWFLSVVKKLWKKVWQNVNNSKTALFATLGLTVALAACAWNKAQTRDPLASVDTGSWQIKLDPGAARKAYLEDLREYFDWKSLAGKQKEESKTSVLIQKSTPEDEKSKTDIGNSPKDELIKSILDKAGDVNLDSLSKESIIDFFKWLNLDHSFANRAEIYGKLTKKKYDWTQNKEFLNILLKELKDLKKRLQEWYVVKPSQPEEVIVVQAPETEIAKPDDNKKVWWQGSILTMEKSWENKEWKKWSESELGKKAGELVAALNQHPDEDKSLKSSIDKDKATWPEWPDNIKQKNRELFQKIFAVAEKMNFDKWNFSRCQLLDNEYLLFNYRLGSYHMFLPKYDDRWELQIWGKQRNKKFIGGSEQEIRQLLLDMAQELVSLYHKWDKIHFADSNKKSVEAEKFMEILWKKLFYKWTDWKKIDADLVNYTLNNNGTIELALCLEKFPDGKLKKVETLQFKSLEELKKYFEKDDGKNLIKEKDGRDAKLELWNPQVATQILQFAKDHLASFGMNSFDNYDILAVAVFESGLDQYMKDGVMQVIPSTRRHINNLISKNPILSSIADTLWPKVTSNVSFNVFQWMGVLRDFENIRGLNPSIVEFLKNNKENIYLAARSHLRTRVGIELTRDKFEELLYQILSNQTKALAYCTLKNYNGCTRKLNPNEIWWHQFTYGIAVLAISDWLRQNRRYWDSIHLAKNDFYSSREYNPHLAQKNNLRLAKDQALKSRL